MAITIRMLAKGILLFYICLVLINAVTLLPVIFRMDSDLMYDVLLSLPLRGIAGMHHSSSFSWLWQALLAPVVFAAIGMIILRIARLKAAGLYLVLISGLNLSALIIGILFHESSSISRIESAALAVSIISAVLWTFRCSYKTSKALGVFRFRDFTLSVLLPSAIVVFFTGMHMADMWRPASEMIIGFWPVPPPPPPPGSMWSWDSIKLELLLWIYLPIILLAVLGALSTTVKTRKPSAV
jgi:hypothetical protein